MEISRETEPNWQDMASQVDPQIQIVVAYKKKFMMSLPDEHYPMYKNIFLIIQ